MQKKPKQTMNKEDYKEEMQDLPVAKPKFITDEAIKYVKYDKWGYKIIDPADQVVEEVDPKGKGKKKEAFIDPRKYLA